MEKCLGDEFSNPCAKGMEIASLSCTQGVFYAPRACKKSRHNCLFLLLFWVKLALLAQTQVETLTINTSLPHSELWQFKRKETLELHESFYLLLDFLGYVFIYSNLFLVTKCN